MSCLEGQIPTSFALGGMGKFYTTCIFMAGKVLFNFVWFVNRNKPNKEEQGLDNWTPITLLCTDYKIFAHVFSDRLSDCKDITEESQSVIVKGRNINNHTRLILC